MSEKPIRARMKSGHIEFEIEGVASKELEDKIDYVYDVFRKAIKKKRSLRQTKDDIRKIEPTFYNINIQRIIDEEPEWFVEKDIGEVAGKLKFEYGVQRANGIHVNNSLIAFFRSGILTRKEEKGKYYYSLASSFKKTKSSN